LDVQTIGILILSAAVAIAGVAGFVIQRQQVKKTRLENQKLQREIAALREDLTNYQSLVSTVQPPPGVRIEPVLVQEKLPPDIAPHPGGAAQAERSAVKVSHAEVNAYPFPGAPSRPARKPVKAALPYNRKLFMVEGAVVIIGILVMVLAAFAIFYRLSH